jgi:hypothetical protein
LVVSFDIYDNGGGEAPALDVRFGGQTIASTKVPITKIETGSNFVPVVIRVQDGAFDLIYNDEVIYYRVPLTGFAPIAGGQFAFGGRTGGLNENQWIDDLAIATVTGSAQAKISSIRLTQGNIVIEWTGTATLQSAPDITGPWTAVANAASPYSAAPAGGRKFFRLSSQ